MSYQSSGFEDIPVTSTGVQDNAQHQPQYQASADHYHDEQTYNTTPIGAYTGVASDDMIPSHHVSIKEALSPKLERYAGLGIVKYIFWVSHKIQ
jgi:hypothetical protein